jgi:hypothetical protein
MIAVVVEPVRKGRRWLGVRVGRVLVYEPPRRSDEVEHEADRREIELVILPTPEAIKTLQGESC